MFSRKDGGYRYLRYDDISFRSNETAPNSAREKNNIVKGVTRVMSQILRRKGRRRRRERRGRERRRGRKMRRKRRRRR